ncbi:hypothetical protein FQA39_LY09994 [Lamprigera yunnana]|nr:hypothetical protein FQA39_LY09994 [Lamprigera yunnana]
MKFHALVLLVVILSVFEFQSEARDAEDENTNPSGKRNGRQRREGNETREKGHGRGGGRNKTTKTGHATESLLLI